MDSQAETEGRLLDIVDDAWRKKKIQPGEWNFFLL